jgi:hypothetical protein
MFARTLLLVLVLIRPAVAADDWVQDVLGAYQGPVLNGSGIERMVTEFGLDSAGQLTGHYHVDDVPPFDGELTDFHEDAPYRASFIWHDRYGEGVVHIHFDPEHGRFLGLWGDTEPLAGHILTGYRVGPRVGS